MSKNEYFWGGQNVVPTQKIRSRVDYNDKFSMSQAEINASKSTAFKWFAYNKAFQTIDKKNLMLRHWQTQWLLGISR